MAHTLTLLLDVEAPVRHEFSLPVPEGFCTLWVRPSVEKDGSLGFFWACKDSYVFELEFEWRVSSLQGTKKCQARPFRPLKFPANCLRGTGIFFGTNNIYTATDIKKIQVHHPRPTVPFVVDVRFVRSNVQSQHLLFAWANQNLTSAPLNTFIPQLQERIAQLTTQLTAEQQRSLELQEGLEKKDAQLKEALTKKEDPPEDEADANKRKRKADDQNLEFEENVKADSLQAVTVGYQTIDRWLHQMTINNASLLLNYFQTELVRKATQKEVSPTCPVCFDHPVALKYNQCSHLVCALCATKTAVQERCVICRKDSLGKFDPITFA